MNEIVLQENEYITQVLLQSEYIKWKKGDKILISGSPNTGKTKFAVEYAVNMHDAQQYRTLYITSRSLAQMQLFNHYVHIAHNDIEFKSYQSFLNGVVNTEFRKIEKFDIIIIDECATFFNDALIKKLGNKIDLLLTHLLDSVDTSYACTSAQRRMQRI